MQRVGLANYVIDGKNLNFEDLKKVFEELLASSAQVREILKLTSVEEQKSALHAVELVRDLLN